MPFQRKIELALGVTAVRIAVVNGGARAMVIVSHHASYIREHCTRAAVLKEGRLYHHRDLDEAFAFYHDETALAA